MYSVETELINDDITCTFVSAMSTTACVLIMNCRCCIVGSFQGTQIPRISWMLSFMKFNSSKKRTTHFSAWAFGRPIHENKVMKKLKTDFTEFKYLEKANYTVLQQVTIFVPHTAVTSIYSLFHDGFAHKICGNLSYRKLSICVTRSM